MGTYDDETAALEAAIRTPWNPPTVEPYAPAPPARAAAPAPFAPPRPIGYVPMPVYRYPGPARYGYPPGHGPAAWGPAVRVSQRELSIAYLLWFFLGFLGVHHFYLGNILRGVLYLLTGGLLGVGILVDLFLLPSLTRRRNAEALGRLYPLAR